MELDQIILGRISKEAGVSTKQASATIALLEDQATVPFIARYRKELTQNLDEVQIRTIAERHDYYKELLARRETILRTIEEQGKLTDELRIKVSGCYEKNELEDLYLPFKPKRKTKATVAIDKGLEPLASFIWEQTPAEKSIDELADTFINSEKGVPSREEALEGALHVIAEWISEDTEIRKSLREIMLQEGVVVSKVAKGREGQKSKFDMYYDFREPVAKIPSHRMLAIRRGVKEQYLTFSIEIDEQKASRLVSGRVIKDPQSAFAVPLEIAVKDSYGRLLSPSLQAEVRAILKERSDSEAIKVFEANLSNLLLAPPAGPITVMGIDPGFRTGCKVAVIDETGRFLESATIYPTEPKQDAAGAEITLFNLVQKYSVRAIAIGNGTASRETDTFVRNFLDKYQHGQPFEPLVSGDRSATGGAVLEFSERPKHEAAESAASTPLTVEPREFGGQPGPPAEESIEDASVAVAVADEIEPLTSDPGEVFYGRSAAVQQASQAEPEKAAIPLPDERHPVFSIIVNEAGASVYSASEGARREFPDLDLTVRGSISIARRLQDPLAELVKIHPKSIGVGQYQHDVDQRRLKEGLEATVESCVNRVGVDLNTASYELLRYVSGLNRGLAKGVVEYRNRHGKFTSRPQLLGIPGFGEKTYEQAAGFLRIRGGENPLDETAVHPESYPVVERMAQSLGTPPAELIGNSRLLESLDLQRFVDEKVGLYTLNDIKQELQKPGRDPRDEFRVPAFREDVKEISDLKEGMILEGTVTNVTNFGAFVDIGVHQDGLVHVSELSNRFVKDPREAVHVGEVVKVKLIGVDLAMKRISLSIKALLPKPKKAKPAKVREEASPLPGIGVSKPVKSVEGTSGSGAVKPTAPKNDQRQIKTQPSKPKKVPKAEVKVQPKKDRKPPDIKKPEPSPQQNLSFEEKIRLLQEKFGGLR
jgi:protein Tex